MPNPNVDKKRQEQFKLIDNARVRIANATGSLSGALQREIITAGSTFMSIRLVPHTHLAFSPSTRRRYLGTQVDGYRCDFRVHLPGY